ncbi:MAG: hypothetical protein ACPGNV_18415 [Mangrovicoccus sp.]
MDDADRKQLREEMAAAMDIALYGRFSGAEAARIIGVSHATLDRARSRGEIAYINKGKRLVEYFGFQIMDYFIDRIEREERHDQKTLQPEISVLNSQSIEANAALVAAKQKLIQR